MSRIQMQIMESGDCHVVHIEKRKRLLGNIHWHVLKSEAITKYDAEEVQAVCYLKFLHYSKQWDLFRGNRLGLYVDFRGDGSQSDLCHVERAVHVTSVVLYPNSLPPRSHARPHLVAKNASGLQWVHHLLGRGAKSLTVYSPVCHFRRSRNCTFPVDSKKWNKYMIKRVVFPYINLTYFAFFPIANPKADMWAEGDKS